MKIRDVELLQYRWERARPIRNGMHTYSHSGLSLVRIETDDGHCGLGWAGMPQTPGMAKVAQGLLEHFKPMLIGEDPFNTAASGIRSGYLSWWAGADWRRASSAASISRSGI